MELSLPRVTTFIAGIFCLFAFALPAAADNGIARCLNALSGRLLWKERLKGGYRASPIAAEGRVYFLNLEGLTTVVSASPRFDRLTENQLEDATIASPAVSDGKIFICGRKRLYCLRP